MSCKARMDKMSWNLPGVHIFAGDYGPFKPKGNAAAIEDVLVLLTATSKDNANDHNRHCSREEDDGVVCRHPMYKYAI